jgi:hypothetical protein
LFLTKLVVRDCTVRIVVLMVIRKHDSVATAFRSHLCDPEGAVLWRFHQEVTAL